MVRGPQPFVRVAAAIIREGSRFLVTRRPDGGRHGGFWEFPGGKVEPGETSEQALEREIREELGVGVRVGRLVRRFEHCYDDRTVELCFHEATLVDGAPQPLQVAALAWRRPEEMESLPILPADLVVVGDLKRLVGGAP